MPMWQCDKLSSFRLLTIRLVDPSEQGESEGASVGESEGAGASRSILPSRVRVRIRLRLRG